MSLYAAIAANDQLSRRQSKKSAGATGPFTAPFARLGSSLSAAISSARACAAARARARRPSTLNGGVRADTERETRGYSDRGEPRLPPQHAHGERDVASVAERPTCSISGFRRQSAAKAGHRRPFQSEPPGEACRPAPTASQRAEVSRRDRRGQGNLEQVTGDRLTLIGRQSVAQQRFDASWKSFCSSAHSGEASASRPRHNATSARRLSRERTPRRSGEACSSVSRGRPVRASDPRAAISGSPWFRAGRA
mgnify:CR=1 FL=1